MKRKIIVILAMVLSFCLGVYITRKKMKARLFDEKKCSDRYLQLFMLMCSWMRTKQQGKKISEYLEKNNFNTVAIYGMSHVGKMLKLELANNGIEVKYGIDKAAGDMYVDLEMFAPEDELPDVDAVIVTAVFFFDEIKQEIEQKVLCPIMSLEEILTEL